VSGGKSGQGNQQSGEGADQVELHLAASVMTTTITSEFACRPRDPAAGVVESRP
jgi:hypothetical protein